MAAELLIIGILILTLAGIKIAEILKNYLAGRESYEQLQSEMEEENGLGFTKLKELNPDIIAWISIPGTEIDYPVLFSREQGKYLHRLPDGTSNTAGSIFMDSGCIPDFSGVNTILYGHNMKNGTMFAGLTDYMTQDYFEARRTVKISLPEEEREYDIIAAYEGRAGESKAYDPGIAEEELGTFLREAMSISFIDSGLNPDDYGQVLVLSTCLYDAEDARMIVLAVR